ncbi:MAG: hypothetical protein ACYDCO_05870 [Armatimonadota bacterium]
MPSPTYYEGQPLTIGHETQLLLDDLMVEDRFNLERVVHFPVKYDRNPILVRDKPWEGTLVSHPSVIWDEECGKFRMWYLCFNVSNYYGTEGGAVYYTAYAESDDGFHWEKPLLDLCPLGEHARTNIVYLGNMPDAKGKRMFSQGQVFKDDADLDPARRYKMVGLDGRPHPRFPDDINTEPSLLVSPDGLHWTLTGDRPMLDHHSDTRNHLVHDPRRGRWLLYVRPTIYASGQDMGPDRRHHRRRICVMTSADLVTWSYPRVILYPDERDLPDYDNCTVFRYGSHFLMFYAVMDGDGLARFETRIASSGDGIHWERVHSRETFLGLGPQGAWDAGAANIKSEPVRQGENLLLYYSGANLGQYEGYHARQDWSGGIGVAQVKQDRFVAQRAGDRTGYLLTREFILEGNTLWVNLVADGRPYRTPRLRVEVLRHPPLGEHADYFYTERGYSYRYEGFGLDDCAPLAGDGTAMRVRWKGRNLGELLGKPVYLRFELQNMDLYAFRVGQE